MFARWRKQDAVSKIQIDVEYNELLNGNYNSKAFQWYDIVLPELKL